MSKLTKITLLALAAFLLLGFSIVADAAKGEKEHQLVSAPLWGDTVSCIASNLTDETLSVRFLLYSALGQVPEQDPLEIEPGKVNGWNLVNADYMWCKLIWEGQADDVKATLCAWQDASQVDPVGCINID